MIYTLSTDHDAMNLSGDDANHGSSDAEPRVNARQEATMKLFIFVFTSYYYVTIIIRNS